VVGDAVSREGKLEARPLYFACDRGNFDAASHPLIWDVLFRSWLELNLNYFRRIRSMREVEYDEYPLNDIETLLEAGDGVLWTAAEVRITTTTEETQNRLGGGLVGRYGWLTFMRGDFGEPPQWMSLIEQTFFPKTSGIKRVGVRLMPGTTGSIKLRKLQLPEISYMAPFRDEVRFDVSGYII
jgi:hypothetical protein